MTDLRNHDQHARLLGARVNRIIHRERLRGRFKGLEQLLELRSSFSVIGRRKMHPHEEAFRSRIAKLRGVDNVEIVLNQKSRDSMHNAGAVGPREGKDEAWSHLEPTI